MGGGQGTGASGATERAPGGSVMRPMASTPTTRCRQRATMGRAATLHPVSAGRKSIPGDG